jgi:hypothetical protein
MDHDRLNERNVFPFFFLNLFVCYIPYPQIPDCIMKDLVEIVA